MEFIFGGVLIFLLSISFSGNKNHFLMSLLFLECLMIVFLFVFYLKMPTSSLYLFLVFITLSACEGALGLSILVNLVRSYSSDYLLMFSAIVYGSV